MGQDIGHANVKRCLKYVVVASMLSSEDTNPFASQEAAVFKTDSDMMPKANLFDAFDEDDIQRFESTLSRSHIYFFGNEFLAEHMAAVKQRIRCKVQVKLIKPYTRVKLQWLCQQLNATMPEVEQLVVKLVLDHSIEGRLDQMHSLLELNHSEKRHKLDGARDAWISSVARLRNAISSRTGKQHSGGSGMGFYGSQFGIGDSVCHSDLIIHLPPRCPCVCA